MTQKLSLVVVISIILRAIALIIRLLLIVRVHVPEVFIILVELLLHLAQNSRINYKHFTFWDVIEVMI